MSSKHFPTWWRENREKFSLISGLWFLPKKWRALIAELVDVVDFYLGYKQ
jgi:hypothetical protein